MKLQVSTQWPLCLAAACALAALACTGNIVGGGGAAPAGSAAGTGAAAGGGPAAGVTGAAGGAAGTGAPNMLPDNPTKLPPASTCTTATPGPQALRRLTAAQYDQTLRDLFNDPAVPTAVVFSDPIVLGFTADTNALVVQALGAQQLMDQAERVAHWAVTTHLSQLSTCTTNDATCRQQFIRAFGKRAFREPLSDARVKAYDAIFAAEAASTFQDGVETVVAAMLQSPYFLYRRELGAPDAAKSGMVALTPHEIASGLSYLLTGGMPDDQLMAAADSGALATPAEIDRQAQRLLGQPRAQDAVMSFMSGWLGLGKLATTVKDDNVFKLTDTLRGAMASETRALIVDTIFTSNGTLANLLTAPYSFLNRDLAMHYGLTQQANMLGNDVQKVAYGAGSRDVGILGHGSVLVGNAGAAESSPVQRGKLVRTRLLCQDLPPPPANLDTKLRPPVATETTRAHFEDHMKDAQCAVCHKMMDPIGFAFEHYDAFGRWRDQENGTPVDVKGTIYAAKPGTDVPIDGLGGLSSYLAASDEANRCLVRYWAYYAFGSASWNADACTYDAIAAEAGRDQNKLKSVLMGIVHAPRFTQRIKP
jgi:hypothetical protein